MIAEGRWCKIFKMSSSESHGESSQDERNDTMIDPSLEVTQATQVIADMLEASEEVQKSTTSQKTSTKKKHQTERPKLKDMRDSSDDENSSMQMQKQMWEMMQSLKKEIGSLKRTREEDVPGGSSTLVKILYKIPRVSLRSSSAYDRTHENQLSSDKSQQLSSANIPATSESVAKKPLRSVIKVVGAQQPHDGSNDDDHDDDDIDIRPASLGDPLQEEMRQQAFCFDDEDTDEEVADGDLSEGDEEVVDIDDLVGLIDVRGEDELPGPALTQTWADKVNLAWKNKVPPPQLKFLFKKYSIASNLDELKVPKLNREMWSLCTKWQKKADINMANSQRALIKAASAALKLNTLTTSLPRATRQISMQTTADIVSMLGTGDLCLTYRNSLLLYSSVWVSWRSSWRVGCNDCGWTAHSGRGALALSRSQWCTCHMNRRACRGGWRRG